MVKVEKNVGAELKQVVFLYPEAPGHHVSLAGVFNDWDPSATEMLYSPADRAYRCLLTLPSGAYEYKMVVDGAWMLDEGNPNFAANDFGTLNSVLTVN